MYAGTAKRGGSQRIRAQPVVHGGGKGGQRGRFRPFCPCPRKNSHATRCHGGEDHGAASETPDGQGPGSSPEDPRRLKLLAQDCRRHALLRGIEGASRRPPLQEGRDSTRSKRDPRSPSHLRGAPPPQKPTRLVERARPCGGSERGPHAGVLIFSQPGVSQEAWCQRRPDPGPGRWVAAPRSKDRCGLTMSIVECLSRSRKAPAGVLGGARPEI